MSATTQSPNFAKTCGGGNDELYAGRYDNVEFNGTTEIRMGAGNDVAELGQTNEFEFVTFKDDSSFFGGKGADILWINAEVEYRADFSAWFGKDND